MRYRNDGTMPLNYGDGGPWVEPGETFDTADYPTISAAQIESHLLSGFISVVGAPPAPFAGIVDEIHEHQSRELVDVITRARDEK